MRLLIIEDNLDVLLSMKIGLENHGFCVDVADNGIEGEEKAYINEYDLILIDITLPDKNGIDIVKYLRGENVDVPIIIISGCNNHDIIINSFNLGIDDYITKPFLIEELVARVQAVIRRVNGKVNPNIIIGKFNINTVLKKVTYKNKNIDLTSKEYDILEYLAIKYPAIISSEELLEHIYDESFDSFSSVLRVHIAKLRKKIKNISGIDILNNVRGKGYSLYSE